MTAEPAAVVIDTPGVYDGMPDDVYHSDPVPGGSLSSTGARKLTPPGTPAAFRWWADNPAPPNREFDLGHAAHRHVLRAGMGFAVMPADNYRTDKAKTAKAEAYAAGLTPLLPAQLEQVRAMTTKLRQHPLAGPLFEPCSGKPEQSGFWRDGQTGIWRRIRLDWLRNPTSGRFLIPDYKTCANASDDAMERALYSFGYHQQAAYYIDGARALGLAGDDVGFLLVCQEKTAPYLVNVLEVHPSALRVGAALNRDAINLYAECHANNRWPGYDEGISFVSLPPWAARQYEVM